MQTISLKEWQDKGLKLFGKNPKLWEFKCPQCGHVQSIESMKKHTPNSKDDLDGYVHFSCEGRINREFGCDWTLGGLFKIHNTEVLTEDGEAHPVFEFNESSAEQLKDNTHGI